MHLFAIASSTGIPHDHQDSTAPPPQGAVCHLPAGSPFDTIVRMLTLHDKAALYETCRTMRDTLAETLQLKRLKQRAGSCTTARQMRGILGHLMQYEQRTVADGRARQRVAAVLAALPDDLALDAIDTPGIGAALGQEAIQACGLPPLELALRAASNWDWHHGDAVSDWAASTLAKIKAMPGEQDRVRPLVQWIRWMNSKDPELVSRPLHTVGDHLDLARLVPVAHRGRILSKVVPLLDALPFAMQMQGRKQILAEGMAIPGAAASRLQVLQSLAKHFPRDSPEPGDIRRAEGFDMLLADWHALLAQAARHVQPDSSALVGSLVRVYYGGWLWDGIDERNVIRHRQASWEALAAFADVLDDDARFQLLLDLAAPDHEIVWEKNEARRTLVFRLAGTLPTPSYECVRLALLVHRLGELENFQIFVDAQAALAPPETVEHALERLDQALQSFSPDIGLLARVLHVLPATLLIDDRVLLRLASHVARALCDAGLPPEVREDLAACVLRRHGPVFFKLSIEARNVVWHAVDAAPAERRAAMLGAIGKLELRTASPDLERWLASLDALPVEMRMAPVRAVLQGYVRRYGGEHRQAAHAAHAAHAANTSVRNAAQVVPGLLARLAPRDRATVLVTLSASLLDPNAHVIGNAGWVEAGLASLTALKDIAPFDRLGVFEAILKMMPDSAPRSTQELASTLDECVALLPSGHRAAGRAMADALLESLPADTPPG